MNSEHLIDWIHSFKSSDCIHFDWRNDLSDGKIENYIVEELISTKTPEFNPQPSTLEQRAHNFNLLFLQIKNRSDLFPLTNLPASLTAEDTCLSLAAVCSFSFLCFHSFNFNREVNYRILIFLCSFIRVHTEDKFNNRKQTPFHNHSLL